METGISGLPKTSEPGSGQFRIVAGRESFGTRLLVVEIVIRAGNEPPLRRHRNEDLLMIVLDGRLTFHVDGKHHQAAPGSSLIVTRGCAHGFVIDSEYARLLMVLSPAGAEELIVELFSSPGIHGDASETRSCDVIDHLVTTAARYDVDITGPPPERA